MRCFPKVAAKVIHKLLKYLKVYLKFKQKPSEIYLKDVNNLLS